MGVEPHVIAYQGSHGWAGAAATGLITIEEAINGLRELGSIVLPSEMMSLSYSQPRALVEFFAGGIQNLSANKSFYKEYKKLLGLGR